MYVLLRPLIAALCWLLKVGSVSETLVSYASLHIVLQYIIMIRLLDCEIETEMVVGWFEVELWVIQGPCGTGCMWGGSLGLCNFRNRVDCEAMCGSLCCWIDYEVYVCETCKPFPFHVFKVYCTWMWNELVKKCLKAIYVAPLTNVIYVTYVLKCSNCIMCIRVSLSKKVFMFWNDSSHNY